MKQWPSAYGAGLPNQRSQVQKLRVAEGQSMNIKNSWGLGG